MGATAEVTFLPLVLLAGGTAAWFALNRALFDDILSPFSLLFVAWVGPLLLQATNLSSHETPWTLGPMLMVGWTTLALAGTCLLAAGVVRAGPPGAEARDHFRAMQELLRAPAFIAGFFACFLVCFAAYVYAEFVTNPFGVPLLSILSGQVPRGGAFHRWGKDGPLTALTALLFVLTPIAYLAFQANRGRPLRATLLVAALAFPVGGVLKLSRSDVFIGMVELLVVAVYWRRFAGERVPRRRQLLTLAGVVLAGLLVYYVMMAIRISSVPLEDIYARLIGFRLEGDSPWRGPLAAIYGYMALPFENLHRFLAVHDGGSHVGISVFRPILSLSGMGDLADRIDAGIHYPAPATYAAGSATFLTSVYAELGILGVAAVPIAYAALVNALYVHMRARPTFLSVLLYANFVYPWLWLFFNNGFGVLSIYLNAAFIAAVALLMPELRPRVARLAPATR
jgi:hypothetical protein